MAGLGFGMGSNPRFGRDTGPMPPQMMGGATYPGAGPQMPYPMPMPPHPYAGYPNPYMPYAAPQFPFNTLPLGARPPQPLPPRDPDLPAAQMTNSTGGVGCEPGYNYFFPSEHTKIHVLRSGKTPPWQLPPSMKVDFHACQVPCNVTLAELLAGFGATNPDPRMNRVTEVTQANGKWYKGLSYCGDDGGEMGKPIREFGWDASRTGLLGDKGPVWLYITKG